MLRFLRRQKGVVFWNGKEIYEWSSAQVKP